MGSVWGCVERITVSAKRSTSAGGFGWSWGAMKVFYFFFFFQAEDGIRDLYVTGVQTCALPISANSQNNDAGNWRGFFDRQERRLPGRKYPARLCSVSGARKRRESLAATRGRSEERRVGKECRARGARGRSKKNQKATKGVTQMR